jgi:regulator of ribonuclease activity A
MDFLTAELCDEHGDIVAVVAPIFHHFGAKPRFAGPISTLKVFEDNSLVRTALSEPGQGRVLVVDGGGSLQCALLGDHLGSLALTNHWAGIVIYGAIRDSVALGQMPLGIRALATHPRKSVKRGAGSRELIVEFGGVRFEPGHWLYADEDGIIVTEVPLF